MFLKKLRVALHRRLERAGLSQPVPLEQWMEFFDIQPQRPPIAPEQYVTLSQLRNLSASQHRHALRASYHMREAARELEIILRTRPSDTGEDDV